MSEMSVYNDR